MSDPLPRTRTVYRVSHRIATRGGWVNVDAEFPEPGWAVSAMHRRANRDPHLDWRVTSGGGLNGADGPLVVHRLRLAGTPGPDRTEPTTEAPRTMTVEQTWKRLPPIPEDDPF
jgi:hypothetical protein